ncbi:hypothetical protein E2986_06415 [Frieseomelitta varia]|uniref:ERAP1-like C-terminal domain-containing protein n=1 Tax=Frieseomelitta varia TaxID=561572 RepID=A0A833RX49_9HYME|nr:hypothetical protein E2986_06415 [Frieseomelitta varia]
MGTLLYFGRIFIFRIILAAQCMPQFSGGPVEFMTCDDIQCKRADGWFLSYTKIAGIIVVFIIGVVAAGFLGWYINSLPQKKDYEALDLLNDEIENTDDLGENTASPFVHPLKYRLELTPIIIDINLSSKLFGRVFIEFQVNDTTGVNKLSLNAKNITTTNCKLTLLHLEENKKPSRKRRRRRANDAINHNGQWDDTISEKQMKEMIFVIIFVSSLDSSLVIDTFDDSPPISPHNLAFVMGHIEAINATLIGDTEVVATFWRDSNRTLPEIYLFDKLNSVVVNLMDVFLTSYPYPKLDLVGLPLGINENMGSPGLIAINFDIIRKGFYYLIRKYNSTDVVDFMNILAEGAMELPPGVSLVQTINSWIFQGGYPLVTVIRNYMNESAVIYQEQFSLDRPLESITKFWYIPLSYTNNYSNWSSPSKIWFPPELKITLDNIGSNESWILFNVNKTGFYRVNYDDRNWMLLKLALVENHDSFPAETRASLIDDVFSLAEIGFVKYEAAFEFIKYMQMKERHYIPWGAFMRHMLKLNRLLYETSVFNDFQEFMVRFVSPLYSEVGSKLDEGSPLTMIAVKLACVFEHSECLNWTKNVFESDKTDDEVQELVPSYIRETFYCTIARYGTRKVWNYFTEKVTSTEDEEERRRLLSSFACFQAPWILQS